MDVSFAVHFRMVAKIEKAHEKRKLLNSLKLLLIFRMKNK